MSHDELLEQFKPVVGSEIQATMLTQGQQLEKRIYDKGYEEGQAHGERGILLRLLEHRFGPLPASVAHRVSEASADELMRWSERVLDAESLDDVFAGL
ncbi:MAG: hypothetical protein Tsb0020_15090 [Haliangiales bacterium]